MPALSIRVKGEMGDLDFWEIWAVSGLKSDILKRQQLEPKGRFYRCVSLCCCCFPRGEWDPPLHSLFSKDKVVVMLLETEFGFCLTGAFLKSFLKGLAENMALITNTIMFCSCDRWRGRPAWAHMGPTSTFLSCRGGSAISQSPGSCPGCAQD